MSHVEQGHGCGQYLRCTVTCSTQLSCPASLVATHWYSPVLICVRFFSRTCPGLEMSGKREKSNGFIRWVSKRTKKLQLWVVHRGPN